MMDYAHTHIRKIIYEYIHSHRYYIRKVIHKIYMYDLLLLLLTPSERDRF